ncbi:hypothetical protein CF8_3425 [Nocardioides sp. CF8]|uniref:hypothetical protein n=1 Tax=Nocardioides sp. CF8 TaxID=110319 RepID=UPI00032D962A|nr:hypothetical protein [Nocardioides sp. CF8]EON22822.1 hypothetical protein CF8_3425 [Nocardioides sp. CF8]
MTTTELAPTGTNSRTRMAGLACLLAGLLGAAGGLYLALRTPLVAEDMWTYPQRAGGEFATTQTMFALTHVGMFLGLLALGWCGAVPPSRWARIARAAVLAGMALLAVNELVAITVAGEPSDSASAGNVGAVYGVATLMIALGMIVAGAAAIRGGAWSGWQQWLPLVVGAWLIVPTMPALFLEGDAARLALGGWSLLFALLGWVLWRDEA